MSTLLKKCELFLRHYYLEGVLLFLIVSFLYLQSVHNFYIITSIFVYVFSFFFANNSFLRKQARRLLCFIKRYKYEEILLLLIIIFLHLQSLNIGGIIIVAFFYLLSAFLFNSTFVAKSLWNGVVLFKKHNLEVILFLIISSFLFLEKISFLPFVVTLVIYSLIVLIISSNFLTKKVIGLINNIKSEKENWMLLLIVIILLLIWRFSYESITFLVIFISFVLYGWDSRVTAGGALASLVSCPILLITKQDALAEQMAVYAYYFLIITVVLQIIDFKRHPELYHEHEEQ